ncbi:hypothetical protein ZTR_01958 [Talaromyces verruculosus]|nr:hypothetical protein ZTR_01958 [Talaromyces verruculosus]
MDVEASLAFTPALGQTVPIRTGESSIVIYASSLRPVSLLAKTVHEETFEFEPINIDVVIGKLLTYKVSLQTSSLHRDNGTDLSIYSGQQCLGIISFVQIQAAETTEREFWTEVSLEEGEDSKSQVIEWLDPDNWEGWAWYRPRETWIEASFCHLRELSPQTPTHALLVRPTTPTIHPESALAVFPASSQDAFVYLTANRNGEPRGVYARVRRVKPGARVSVHVTGKLVHRSKTTTAISGAIDLARIKYGLSLAPFKDNGFDESPFERLGFCTWSSIGENVLLTRDLIEGLVKSLHANDVPIGSFIIDDGWQDIRYGRNGAERSRGLWSFGTWEGMNCGLRETVDLIKQTLPTVKDVGVWMTLAGYWNSIVPESPLAKEYEMRTFQLNRDNVPGIKWQHEGFDGQQSGTSTDPKDRVWCLPPKHLAYKFWKDYFSACATAGITFVKVDNQAYGSFLDGVDGLGELVALWNGMTQAANETFGENRVIHCMAHYERTFNGDIGMGAATENKKIIIRNSDDFGLPRPNVHRDHVHYNIYNAVLISQLCFIPDADMFMTSTQWPEYHAVLRAFFDGPILLADKLGEFDRQILAKLIGRTPKTNEYRVIKAPRALRPLGRNVWDRFLDGGLGPSLQATSYFPEASAANIVLWNARNEARDPSVDILFESDLLDAVEEGLAEEEPSPTATEEIAIWACNAGKGTSVTVRRYEEDTILSSTPLISATIAPQSVQILTVAPYKTIGTVRIANLGLIDKYAGLSAIRRSEVKRNTLSTDIAFQGILGFLVAGTGVTPQVRVNNTLTQCTVRPVGDGHGLIEVDLTNMGIIGMDSYTVDVSF